LKKRALGKTGIDIAPLVFGGNVFGWTIDEKASFEVLDAFVDHGFNAIDTADVYSAWATGNKGGESETIIGRWLKARPALRDEVVLFTKVGSDLGEPGKAGLSERWILQAVDASLTRLRVEQIDLYFSHWPDANTPIDQTLGAYAKLLEAGKVRAIGASNLQSEQLREALTVARNQGLPRYEVLQPEYNLHDRSSYDGALRDLCIEGELGVVTYYSLASGFLSGKYRSEADLGKSVRGPGIAKYFNSRGAKILAALDEVSSRHDVQPVEIALAWLIARPGVTAPIVSATSPAQVESFAKAASLSLCAEDAALLNEASAL
jgi:aryl-alcohol dehydrogenase-like predicted oxidoreductase